MINYHKSIIINKHCSSHRIIKLLFIVFCAFDDKCIKNLLKMIQQSIDEKFRRDIMLLIVNINTE
jgi:hypothetical protein